MSQILQSWNRKKLRDIVDFQYGYTASATGENTGTKLLRITDIVPDLVDWEATPYCEIEKEKIDQYEIKVGDIFVARTGATAGYAKLIRRKPPKAVFASYLIRLKMNDKNANANYVGRVIESAAFKDFVATHAGGSAQPHANAPVLKNFEILMPPLSVQNNIVEVLSAYDDLIENNNRRIRILEEMAQKIYTEWFVNFRFPGRQYQSLPKNWETTTLGKKVEVKRGKNITKNKVTEGRVPVVAGGMEPAYYHDTINASAPVVTVSASGANAGFVNIYFEDIWASDCSYINKEATEFVHFFYCLLKNKQKEVTHLQRGSAQPHVYPKDLMSLSVTLPTDNSLIQRFETAISPIYSMIRKLKKEINTLRQTRDLLIPQLVTGKLEVKV